MIRNAILWFRWFCSWPSIMREKEQEIDRLRYFLNHDLENGMVRCSACRNERPEEYS